MKWRAKASQSDVTLSVREPIHLYCMHRMKCLLSAKDICPLTDSGFFFFWHLSTYKQVDLGCRDSLSESCLKTTFVHWRIKFWFSWITELLPSLTNWYFLLNDNDAFIILFTFCVISLLIVYDDDYYAVLNSLVYSWNKGEPLILILKPLQYCLFLQI